MKDLIFNVLAATPNLTGREIAKVLGIDKKEVNSFLDKNRDIFIKDGEHRWCNSERKVEQEIIIPFPSGWVDARKFEIILSDHPNLFRACPHLALHQINMQAM